MSLLWPAESKNDFSNSFGSVSCYRVSRPWGYKTFFMLNSIEHEILNAHKYKNIKKFSFF